MLIKLWLHVGANVLITSISRTLERQRDDGEVSYIFNGSTDNGTGDTDSLSRSLLGNSLIFALFVEASPWLSPHQLSGLFALLDHALALGCWEQDGLHRLCQQVFARKIRKFPWKLVSSQFLFRFRYCVHHLSISSNISNSVSGIDSILAESA